MSGFITYAFVFPSRLSSAIRNSICLWFICYCRCSLAALVFFYFRSFFCLFRFGHWTVRFVPLVVIRPQKPYIGFKPFGDRSSHPINGIAPVLFLIWNSESQSITTFLMQFYFFEHEIEKKNWTIYICNFFKS